MSITPNPTINVAITTDWTLVEPTNGKSIVSVSHNSDSAQWAVSDSGAPDPAFVGHPVPRKGSFDIRLHSTQQLFIRNIDTDATAMIAVITQVI